MCIQDDAFIRLMACAHGAFHLRVGNNTLHLTAAQVVLLRQELNRCVKPTVTSPLLSRSEADDRLRPFTN